MVNNEETSELQNRFMFGLISMPRLPFVNVLLLMLSGAALWTVQMARALTPAVQSAIVAGKPVLDPPDVYFWPTGMCLVLAFYIYRTISLRGMIRGIRKNSLDSGFELPVKDAEDVAMAVRQSVVGMLLAVASLIVFAIAEVLLMDGMLYLYLKFVTA